MSVELEALWAHELGRADPREANRAIDRMREAQAGLGPEALSYELVVPPQGGWRHVTEVALPRLVYFLDCRGRLAARTPGVFVSVFDGDALHFVEAGVFVDYVAQRLGLDLDALRARWGERAGGPGDPHPPLLLGAK